MYVKETRMTTFKKVLINTFRCFFTLYLELENYLEFKLIILPQINLWYECTLFREGRLFRLSNQYDKNENKR